jgi:hypothetical protein
MNSMTLLLVMTRETEGLRHIGDRFYETCIEAIESRCARWSSTSAGAVPIVVWRTGLRPNTEYIDAESSMQDHLTGASSKS